MTQDAENQVEDLDSPQSACAQHDLARGALLQGINPYGSPAPPPTAEQLRFQELVMERSQAESARYEAREAKQRQEMRDESIRAQSLHGALMLDYPAKAAASVVAAAREIEAFMRGEPAKQETH